MSERTTPIDKGSAPKGDKAARTTSPASYAAALAIPYFLVSWLYILVTTPMANAMARDQEHLAFIETMKGTAFIFLSAVFLFGLAWALFSRLKKKQRELDRTNTALIMAENRAIAGVFASSIAHDMNNIMMGLYNDVMDYSSQGGLTPEEQERANRLSFAAKEMMELARNLSQSGRSGTPGIPERVVVSESLGEIVAFARHHRSVRHCEIEEVISPSAAIDGIPVILRQIFLNLILNAAEATEGRGKIRITCNSDSGNSVLEVHDSGPGIPEEKRESIFNAFVTSKDRGSGLGLHSVKAGVELHGGEVTVGDSPLGGALFTVRIPSGSREFITSELKKLNLTAAG
ncbi:MAG: HAMP domain-containing histidine kinase [Candidatus Sumerlaeia bacterium]|nr:HAMP domain-containing histidine kinase [Candidatus Sumerlaeia bacterium]